MFTKNKNERGGILLELTILVYILAAFSTGVLRLHHSLERRFGRILAERNAAISRARSR